VSGNSSSDNQPEDSRDVIATALARIYRGGLTSASGGNLSIRDDGGTMWITPARLDKGTLRGTDVVRVSPDGAVEGPSEPSSELPFHLALYGTRPDVRAIAHAHPAALGAWAICHRVPDLSRLPRAIAVCGGAGIVPYERTGTIRLARRIADAFAAGVGCALLENHGVIAVGADMREAIARLEALDGAARILARAAALGGPAPSPGSPAVQSLSLPARQPSTRGDPVHREERDLLCRFARRAYDRGLLAGQPFCMSIRLGDDTFLATSGRMDAAFPDGADIAHVRLGTTEATRAADIDHHLHYALYEAHPVIRAVITASPVHTTAFSLSGENLDPRMLSESLLVLRRVVRVPTPIVVDEPRRVASLVGPDAPAALLEHLGALVLGGSFPEAFDRLEVLEGTAEALVESRRVGDPVPLNDESVAELVSMMRSTRTC